MAFKRSAVRSRLSPPTKALTVQTVRAFNIRKMRTDFLILHKSNLNRNVIEKLHSCFVFKGSVTLPAVEIYREIILEYIE